MRYWGRKLGDHHGFTVAVAASYAWLTALAVDLEGRTRREDMQPAPSAR